MEEHFEDFFFKEYYYFLKEAPKGSEGGDLFNTKIKKPKQHINRMAEKQMQGWYWRMWSTREAAPGKDYYYK